MTSQQIILVQAPPISPTTYSQPKIWQPCVIGCISYYVSHPFDLLFTFFQVWADLITSTSNVFFVNPCYKIVGMWEGLSQKNSFSKTCLCFIMCVFALCIFYHAFFPYSKLFLCSFFFIQFIWMPFIYPWIISIIEEW